MNEKLFKINELSEDIQEEIIDRETRDCHEEIRKYVKNELLKKCRFDKTGYLIDNGLGKGK